MNLVELVEVRDKITWYKCKICGCIFNEGNNSKQHGCLYCYGDPARKEEAIREYESSITKRSGNWLDSQNKVRDKDGNLVHQ
jgi:protein-arginine kinase activator protein McsA